MKDVSFFQLNNDLEFIAHSLSRLFQLNTTQLDVLQVKIRNLEMFLLPVPEQEDKHELICEKWRNNPSGLSEEQFAQVNVHLKNIVFTLNEIVNAPPSLKSEYFHLTGKIGGVFMRLDGTIFFLWSLMNDSEKDLSLKNKQNAAYYSSIIHHTSIPLGSVYTEMSTNGALSEADRMLMNEIARQNSASPQPNIQVAIGNVSNSSANQHQQSAHDKNIPKWFLGQLVSSFFSAIFGSIFGRN